VADSIVDICNKALIELGEEPILSVFPPDANKRAQLCSIKYDCARQGLLEAANWVCARARAQLAADPVAPAFGYAYAYPLPADFIRMVEIDDDEDWSWEIEGRRLLTDFDPPANIIYICDLTDTTVMTPMFRDALALELASDLCMTLTQSTDKLAQIERKVADVRGRAQSASAQQDSPCEWDVDIWLRARR